MALQTSGAISLANVQTEFGGANPISISEYYGKVAGIPASGTISLSHFYGKSNIIREPDSGEYFVENGNAFGWTVYTSGYSMVYWNTSTSTPLVSAPSATITAISFNGYTYYRGTYRKAYSSVVYAYAIYRIKN